MPSHEGIDMNVGAERAIKMCPHLGKLPVEQAMVLAEMAAMGGAIIEEQKDKDISPQTNSNTEHEATIPVKETHLTKSASKNDGMKSKATSLSAEVRAVLPDITISPQVNNISNEHYTAIAVFERDAIEPAKPAIRPSGDINERNELSPALIKIEPTVAANNQHDVPEGLKQEITTASGHASLLNGNNVTGAQEAVSNSGHHARVAANASMMSRSAAKTTESYLIVDSEHASELDRQIDDELTNRVKITEELLIEEGVIKPTEPGSEIDEAFPYNNLLDLARQEVAPPAEEVRVTDDEFKIDSIGDHLTVDAGEQPLEPEVLLPIPSAQFQEIQLKIAELEPTEASRADELLDEIMAVLAEAKLVHEPAELEHQDYENTKGLLEIDATDRLEAEVLLTQRLAVEGMPIIPEAEQPAKAEQAAIEQVISQASEEELQIMITEEKLQPLVLEFFQVLGIESSEKQIKKLVQSLTEQKEIFTDIAEQTINDRGTHEILSHMAAAFSDIKHVLEPAHTLLGRIVLIAHQKLTPEIAYAG